MDSRMECFFIMTLPFFISDTLMIIIKGPGGRVGCKCKTSFAFGQRNEDFLRSLGASFDWKG